MTFVVVATGNHFWMDAVLGAVVACVSAYVAKYVLARARPTVLGVLAGPGRRDGLMAAPRRGAPTAQEISAVMRDRLIESRLTPNAISLTGLALNVVAAVLVWQRYFFLAGVAFIVGSIWTRSTGATRACRARARRSARSWTRRSTASRRASCSPPSAPTSPTRGDDLAVAATVAAVLFSLMVSYTRARAEALGVECKVGIATRAVRVVILSIGLVFASGASLGDFELLEPASTCSPCSPSSPTVQRIFHVRASELLQAA